MKKDWLEEKLRNDLGNYPSPMDLEGAWTKLEEARKEKKRRLIWIWRFGGVGFLLAGILIIFQINKEPSIDYLPIPQISSKDDKVMADHITPKDDAIIKEINTSSTKVLSEPNIEPLSGPSTSIQKKERSITLNESTLAKNPSKEANIPIGKSPNPLTPSEAKYPENEQFSLLIPLPVLNLQLERPLPKPIFFALPSTPTNLEKRRRSKQELWVVLSGTVGSHHRKLGTNSSDSEINTLIERRDSSERALECYSFSFDIRQNFGSNWYWQSGIRHQLSFEVLEDQYQKVSSKILEDQVTQILKRADGTVSEVREDITVQVTETVMSTIYNTQNLIEIPLLIGYQKDLGPHFGFDVGMGMSYGFIQRREGSILAGPFSTNRYQALEDLNYRQSNIWGAQFQGSAYFDIGDQWQGFGGFQAKFYPNIAAGNANFYERQYFLNGVIGLRFRLGE